MICIQAASKIPGYGSPDLFFPAYFEGTWDCIRECTSISTPKGEEALTQLDQTFVQEAKEHVGERLEYQVSMSGELTDTIYVPGS